MKEEQKVIYHNDDSNANLIELLIRGICRLNFVLYQLIFVLLWFFSSILIIERFFIVVPNTHLNATNFFFLVIFIGFLTNIELLLYYSFAVWREYPFWLDESVSEKQHLFITFPSWLIGFFFISPLFPWGYSLIYYAILIANGVLWTFFKTSFESKIRSWRQYFAKKLLDCSKQNPNLETMNSLLSESSKTSPNFLNHDQSISKFEESSDEDFRELKENSTQWQRRAVLEDGSDQIEGSVLVCFSKNEEMITVSLSFCPPFDKIPYFEAETEDDCVEIKLSQIFLYGARLEIKRIHSQTSSTDKNDEQSDLKVQLNYFASSNQQKEDALSQ